MVKKTIALFFLVTGALFTVSCSNDDSPFVQVDGFKTVSYGFKMDESSVAGLKVNITYVDQTTVNKGIDYNGNYEWIKSFTVPVGFIPAMTMQVVRGSSTTPQTFPVTIKFKAGITNGGAWSPLEVDRKFNNLTDYNKFFEDNNNKYVLNPYGQGN